MTPREPYDPRDLAHARNTDPQASHDAARQLTTGSTHCLAMLWAHRNNPALGLTDEEAGIIAGLDRDTWGKRGADLRRKGLTEWAREDDGTITRRLLTHGRRAGVSIITSLGVEALHKTTAAVTS